MTDSQAVHAPLNTENEPCGDLSIRTLAMPAETNQKGEIFGGWLLSEMDIGGGTFASKIAKSRTVTVAIDAMNFRKPVFVGDVVSVHANLVRVGKTSVTVHLEAWVLRRKEQHSILVTDGNFTYVSIDDQGRPQALTRVEPPVSARSILIIASGVENLAYEARRFVAAEEKKAIGAAAAAKIPNGCSLFINIGTTTEEVASALTSHEDLLVITNNLNVAMLLYRHPRIEVIMAGGGVRRADGGVRCSTARKAV